ncbi:pentapeptide repeat-containing protein [Saccharothrix longispora]|uniref:Uncharacterized protein YjbI with pentapeptide repeats n=1 Tax=Saccharothrix longispora TaxID=33920 RepID=A0ABU1PSD5_9PSEU|nr:pentapeptide repeat-containing protein [Saccharothrix longispora]MDR6593555.1 uncharacterized protein YjbI with pentapeptide repeats [Saccharothrix longispora]
MLLAAVSTVADWINWADVGRWVLGHVVSLLLGGGAVALLGAAVREMPRFRRVRRGREVEGGGSPAEPRAEREVTIGQTITSFTAIGALLFTGVQAYFTRDQVTAAQEQSWAALRQNEVNEQVQYTDRFAKAVELLDQSGPEHLQGRLGSVYALERLARDSPRDQPTIVEVLSAFVRTNSLPNSTTCPSPQPLTADTRAALTVLGRRNRDHDKDTRVDLSAMCLNGANLVGLNLSNANLSGANLNGATLVRTYLSNPNLGNGNLGDVNPAARFGESLRGADLVYAELRSANLRDVDLSGADLRNADLTDANLNGAHLTGADLAGADLRSADLTNANLTDTDLTNVVHDPKTIVEGTMTDTNTIGQWW